MWYFPRTHCLVYGAISLLGLSFFSPPLLGITRTGTARVAVFSRLPFKTNEEVGQLTLFKLRGLGGGETKINLCLFLRNSALVGEQLLAGYLKTKQML